MSPRRRFDPATATGRGRDSAVCRGWSHGGGKYDNPPRSSRFRHPHGLLALPAGRGRSPAAGLAPAPGAGPAGYLRPQGGWAAQAASSGYAVVRVMPEPA